jgi:hypothetical protein
MELKSTYARSAAIPSITGSVRNLFTSKMDFGGTLASL